MSIKELDLSLKISSPFILLTRPFPKLLATMVVFTTAASLIEGITLSLAIPLIQKLVNSKVEIVGANDSFYIGSLLEFFNRFPQEHQLVAIIISLLMLVAVKGIFRFIGDFSLRTLMIKVGHNLRSICINRFLNLSLAYYGKTKGGHLLSYVNEQTQRCEQLILYVGSLFSECLIVFSFLVLLCSISWKLTLITTAMIIIIAASLKYIVANVKAEGKMVSDTIEEFSSGVFELISGIRIIKAHTAEKFELEKIDRILHQRYKAELKAYAGHAAVHPISDTFGMVVLILLIFLSTRVLSDEIVLPLLLTFMLVLLRTFPRINRLNMLRTSLATFGESFQTIQNFMAETKQHNIVDGAYIFEGLRDQICFESVNFFYDESSQTVLNQINLIIPKGKVTALVGESGSGKSTLADLLLRFYDPQDGHIVIDGRDLREFNLESLRRRIAIVNQETFLFNANVLENIRYGNPDATDSEIVEAARQAYAEDFIKKLPQGFESNLGDRGVRLSGGQRQRLAIARAIVRNPEILILDEATSALDSTSEKLVQQALDKVSQNRTVIVIAHRLSTIHQADRIVVMKQGELVEQGTHEELMSLSGYYRQLNQDQMMLV